MKPYYYRIRCLATGQRYIGSQYGSGADPNNLLCSYTTSSKRVKSLIEQHGAGCFVIEKIVQCPNARQFEAKVLRRLYGRLGKDAFMESFLNRNISPGILMDSDMCKSRAENPIRRRRVSESRKRLYADGYQNPFKGKTHTRSTKDHLSKIAKERFADPANHPRGFLGRQHTDDTRRRMSENCARPLDGMLGEDHPTYGLVWWNNGIEDLRARECPGNEWNRGRVFKPRKKRIKE